MNIPNLSALAVRERPLTLFFILVTAIAGTLAFLQLGRAEDPTFTIKTMTVAVIWPGASAEEMEEQVADRLEKRLQDLRWFDHVNTLSRPGVTFLTVWLSDRTPPSQVAEQFYQVRKRMEDEAPNLPRGVVGPIVNDEYGDNNFALYALQASGMPHRDLIREAEDIRARLLRVPGVGQVDIVGEQPGRIFVEFSTQRLATLGVSQEQLFAALVSQNTVVPAGAVETRGPRVFVRAGGAFDSVEGVAATPITANGRVLRLGDVAEVRRSTEDPPNYVVRHNGAPAIMLGVVMRQGHNGLDLGEALEAEAGAIRAELPLGMALEQVTDQSANIAYAYDEFMVKFAVALLVVTLVGFVSLGFRVGLIVAAAVPLTLAAVFVLMLVTGREFDRITLGALILSLGLLVDDAIIAIEMMVVKMEEGLDRAAAATSAWNLTAAPMLSGTLVTIIGFLPIGFAASSAGEYAGNIFWIVAFALLASWFVAVYFTPYLGVKMLPAIEPRAGGHEAIYRTPIFERARRWIGWAVARRKLVVGATAGLFVLGGVGIGLAEQQFFPSSDRPELLVEVRMPPGTAIGTTEQTARAIERFLRRQPEAQVVNTYLGAGAPRFFLSLNPELPDPAFAKLVILTKDAGARAALAGRLEQEIARGAFPAARVRVTSLLFGPPIPSPVAFRVTGPDRDVLREAAVRVRDVMLEEPAARGVYIASGERSPGVRLAFDSERLRLIGLTPNDAQRQIAGLLSGVPVTQIRDGTRSVEVVARAAERGDLADLDSLTLTTRDGRSVPLSGVARLVPVWEEPNLWRRNRDPYIEVRADVEGAQPPDVTAAILPRLEEIRASLPPGTTIVTAGAVEESAKANAALAAVFPVMILLMLVVIMAQVRNFSLMWMTVLTAPLGVIGAAPALLLFNKPFGFVAILGLIGLAGILMRNTLILIEQIKIERAAGRAPREAVIEATVTRARPVMLTALAAIFAFVPLTFSTFWGPLAYVLIGGTTAGTILTLLFLPALYALWFGVEEREPGRRHSRLAMIGSFRKRWASASK